MQLKGSIISPSSCERMLPGAWSCVVGMVCGTARTLERELGVKLSQYRLFRDCCCCCYLDRDSWQHRSSQELFQGRSEQQRSKRTAQGEIHNSNTSQGRQMFLQAFPGAG